MIQKNEYVTKKELNEIWAEVSSRFKPSISSNASLDEVFKMLENKMKTFSITERQQIWIVMKILEVLHKEIELVSSYENGFKEKKDINVLTKRGMKNKTNLDEIRNYEKFLQSISKDLSGIFYLYVQNNLSQFFKHKMKKDNVYEYLNEYYSHYILGNKWTTDDSLRTNVIDKAEKFFRGFSKKSI